MKSVLAMLAFALAAQAARIEGSVRSSTGEAVPRTVVRLAGAATTVSDDEGKFVFENVEPGRAYRIGAERAGYLRVQGLPVTSENPVITMTPQGVISGRVTDEKGDPVEGAGIVVTRQGYQRSVREAIAGESFSSDDRGEFRAAGLAPGRYYLWAYGGLHMWNVSGGMTGNAPTQFPSAVDVAAGAEIRGVEIRMHAKRLYAIRGKVEPPASDEEWPILFAAPKGAPDRITVAVSPARPPDYTFELAHLEAGEYVIEALGHNLRSAEITITDSDVNGVALAVKPYVMVRGTVVVEGSGGVVWSDQPFRLTGKRTAYSTGVRADGTFHMMGLSEGSYRFEVDSLPEGACVRSARFGEQDALRGSIDVTSAGGELRVVVSKGGGPIEIGPQAQACPPSEQL